MILSPSPIQQFTDGNGVPLVGGLLFIYEAGTVTPQAAYTSSSGATALPNPIVLNARGEVAPSATGTSCGLWLDPTLAYKLILAYPGDTNPPTNPIWTVDNIVSPQAAILAQLAAYQAALTGVPVGGQIPYGGATAPTGWLLCDGAAISRTTYAALFAVIGTAYGSGDGETTFNVPDKRGCTSIGADNMGGTPANRVTSAGSGIDAQVVGTIGGDQLAQTDTLTATSTATSTDSGHTHALISVVDNLGHSYSLGGNANIEIANNPTGIGQANITTTVTTTVTSALEGSSQNMPPVQVDNWIVYTGAA